MAAEGDGREQGRGIKRALILNYSRDKNPGPKRSTGGGGLSQSVISGSDFLKAGEWGV